MMAISDCDEIHSNKEHPVPLDSPAADIVTNNHLTTGGLVIEDGVQIVTSVKSNGLCIKGSRRLYNMTKRQKHICAA